MTSRRTPALLAFVFLSVPLLAASADSTDPAPSASASASGSGSAAPPTDKLSAAIFAGTTPAPSNEDWAKSTLVSGIRLGQAARMRKCTVRHIAEWVRIACDDMRTGRVDILSGEKRDFSVIAVADWGYHGEPMDAMFSMRPGDRRIIQWAMADTWSQVWPSEDGWRSGGGEFQGVMLGVAAQIDWTGPEPTIAIF